MATDAERKIEELEEKIKKEIRSNPPSKSKSTLTDEVCVSFIYLLKHDFHEKKKIQQVEKIMRARVKAMSEWEWQAYDRMIAHNELKTMGAQLPVRFHPSSLPFIPGGYQRFFFTVHHLRRNYVASMVGWGGALAVAGMVVCFDDLMISHLSLSFFFF